MQRIGAILSTSFNYFFLSVSNIEYWIANAMNYWTLYLLISLSLKKQSKPLVKGSRYQTLPGKLSRPLQNGEQGTHNSTDGCCTKDSEDNSILSLSMFLWERCVGGGKGKLFEGLGHTRVYNLLCLI